MWDKSLLPMGEENGPYGGNPLFLILTPEHEYISGPGGRSPIIPIFPHPDIPYHSDKKSKWGRSPRMV